MRTTPAKGRWENGAVEVEVKVKAPMFIHEMQTWTHKANPFWLFLPILLTVLIITITLVSLANVLPHGRTDYMG